MSRSERRQKSEAQLRSLEEQFSSTLIAALRECAAGKWGMFGQNDAHFATAGKYVREFVRSKEADQLLETGEQIESLRQELGYTELFQPYRRYGEYRQMKGSNTSGEPKLAVRFLQELGLA
jgi:hypothetical protein